MSAARIIVDTNSAEDNLFTRLSAKDASCVERARLDVGDVHIIAQGSHIIVERKHVNDLSSSIVDNRYKEQKSRQLAAVAADETGNTSVVWVVQGNLPTSWFATIPPTTVPASRVESAILFTSVRDRIPVLRARDGDACAEIIWQLYTKAKAGELDGAAEAQRKISNGYAGLIHTKKKANMEDPKTVWRAMLSTITGMSAAKADAVCTRFSTPTILLEALRGSPPATARKMLAEVQAGSKKLGPKLADRVCTILMQ